MIAPLVVVVAVAAGCIATPKAPSSGIPAWSTSGCGPVAAPSGPIIDVTPAQASQLGTITRNAPAGATIRFADGTYPVVGDYSHRLVVTQPRVTLRSASGDPTKVTIDGQYSIGALIHVFADDVTITDLTLTRAQDHLVHAYPDAAGPDVDRLRLHRLRLVDAGEQFVKVNPNSARSAYVDQGIVSCSAFTMTATGRANIERAFGCYTGGIDVHGGRDWVVRTNTFAGIYCEDGELAEHAIHFWTGSRGTLVENNFIQNTARGIGFGLVESGESRAYPDNPYAGVFVGHYDGIIRNNVIVASISQYDTGIELDQARGTQVLHNTIVETPQATNSFSSIDYRFANTIVEVRNNLTRRITARNGATGTLTNNVSNTPASWFVNAGTGDVHLIASASGAINAGVVDSVSGTDLDGTAHDQGAPDIGADEYRP